MDYSKVLKDLCLFPAISGHEEKLSIYLKTLFEQYCDEVKIDKFYNVVGLKRGSANDKKKVMVTAHFDEIGFLVKEIDEKGFIRLANVGGIDGKILLAQEVTIHGKKEIHGVIGAKPPHLLKPEEIRKSVKLEDLIVDTGLGADAVKEYITIGDVVTFKAEPLSLMGNKFSSKSVDNRAGVAALLTVMEELNKIKHAHDVYLVATVQEEVGLRGAVIASYHVDPHLAIVLDGCHGEMPEAPKDEVYGLGKGPAVAIGPNLHKKLTKKLIEVAKDENIPHQIDVEPGDTGTEAWATQVSRTGIPTVLISIPVKYMHTTVETVHMNDVKNAGRLSAKFISSMDKGLEEILCC